MNENKRFLVEEAAHTATALILESNDIKDPELIYVIVYAGMEKVLSEYEQGLNCWLVRRFIEKNPCSNN